MINQVIEYVCKEYGIKEYQLKGESRFNEYAIPRQAAWYLLTRVLGVKSKLIGRAFNRDSSTIRAGWRAFERKLHKRQAALPDNVMDFINRVQEDQAEQIEKAVQINIGIQKLAYKYADKLSRKADKLFKKDNTRTIHALAKCLDQLEKELAE